MEFEKLIRDRFSVRKFSNEKVSDELLNKILEAGRIAPTAKNKQPVKIFVIKSDDGLKMVDEFSRCRYNAPICIVICGNKDEAFQKENYNSYEMDASIVTTHMMLEAANLGLGSTWIKLIDENKIIELLNLNDNIVPVCMLNIGYKTEDCPISPLHYQKKTIEEIVEYI